MMYRDDWNTPKPKRRRSVSDDMHYMSLAHIERSKTAQLQNTDPHYTNRSFAKPQTIYVATGHGLKSDSYGPSVNGAQYAYSDRLYQWDWDKAEKAWKEARRQANPDNPDAYPVLTAALFETYLRIYFDDPALELVHIMAGFNVSNGYPYRVYGYIPGKKSAE